MFCDGGRGRPQVNVGVGRKVGAWGKQGKGMGGRSRLSGQEKVAFIGVLCLSFSAIRAKSS